MAIPKTLNPMKLSAILVPADEAANKGLAAAKISSLVIEGKTIAAIDAPLAAKIDAIVAQSATGNSTQDEAETIAAMGTITARNEQLETENGTLTATTAAQAQKISRLESDLNVANATIQKLNADATTNANLLKGVQAGAQALAKDLNGQKVALAQECLRVGALDLRGADGKPLGAEASSEVKLDAAMKLSFDDLFKAYGGALNAAAARIGVKLEAVPSVAGMPAPANAAKKLTIDDEIRERKAAQAKAKYA